MPQDGGLLSGEVDLPFGVVDHAAVLPDAGSAFELPDEAARHVG